MTLSCRSVEDLLLNELLNAGVAIVQGQITATHRGEPPEVSV